MTAITLVRPRSAPRTIPVNTEFDLRDSAVAKIAGVLVIGAIVAFVILFR